MPEVISKHPEITIKVLEEAGAHCGPEFQPRILTKCPPERFCSLPTGEICVYGLPEILQMTQISKQEILQAVSGRTLPAEIIKEPFSFGLPGVAAALFVGVFLGLLIGKKFLRK